MTTDLTQPNNNVHRYRFKGNLNHWTSRKLAEHKNVKAVKSTSLSQCFSVPCISANLDSVFIETLIWASKHLFDQSGQQKSKDNNPSKVLHTTHRAASSSLTARPKSLSLHSVLTILVPLLSMVPLVHELVLYHIADYTLSNRTLTTHFLY